MKVLTHLFLKFYSILKIVEGQTELPIFEISLEIILAVIVPQNLRLTNKTKQHTFFICG